jgi:hypothetical protein
MIKRLTILKFAACLTMLLLGVYVNGQAQEKTKRIGNKPRHGSSNSTHNVVKGNQIGIKMDAGKKPVQLLTLDFGVTNNSAKPLKFKVNVYEFNDILSGENFVKKDIVAEIPIGKTRVNVDLSPYNLEVKRDLLVTIEWLESVAGAAPAFAIGVFNGGSFEYANGKWKKIPLFGLDFNITVKKLKK